MFIEFNVVGHWRRSRYGGNGRRGHACYCCLTIVGNIGVVPVMNVVGDAKPLCRRGKSFGESSHNDLGIERLAARDGKSMHELMYK